MDGCDDLPSLNNGTCFCKAEVCAGGGYCNITEGCSTFIDCPQNYTVYQDDSYCLCNGSLMDPKTHHCFGNESLPLYFHCNPMPDIANVSGCICENTTICYEGKQKLLCSWKRQVSMFKELTNFFE